MSGLQSAIEKYHDYSELKALGSGGIGNVSLLHNPLGGKVVLKVFREKGNIQGLIKKNREAMACMVGIEDPSIQKILDISEEHRCVFLSFVEGDSNLKEEFKNIKNSSARIVKAESLFRKMIKNWEMLVRNGVRHGDVKPSNMLSSGGLIDPDVASYLRNSKVRNENLVYGTLRYMSPEVLRHSSSETSDLFSIGVSFDELLYGYHDCFHGTALSTVSFMSDRSSRGYNCDFALELESLKQSLYKEDLYPSLRDALYEKATRLTYVLAYLTKYESEKRPQCAEEIFEILDGGGNTEELRTSLDAFLSACDIGKDKKDAQRVDGMDDGSEIPLWI